VNVLREILILINDSKAHVDNEVLELLPDVLEQMRLCIPIGSQREEWFPAFLNSAEKLPGFHEVNDSLEREEASASETLRRYLHVDARDARHQSARICGRLLQLKDRFGRGATRHSKLRTIFPSGSFSRFQARVLEAFPHPVEDAAPSTQTDACETFLSRNFVRLSWRGTDGKLCYFHSFMLHNDRDIEFAWIAWLWTSSDSVDVFLEGQREGDMTTVMGQMVEWMEEASTIKRRQPALKLEKLRASAFFADKAALLDDGADSFLKPHEIPLYSPDNGKGAQSEGAEEQKGCGQGGLDLGSFVQDSPHRSHLNAAEEGHSREVQALVSHGTRTETAFQEGARRRSASDALEAPPEKRIRMGGAHEEKGFSPEFIRSGNRRDELDDEGGASIDDRGLDHNQEEEGGLSIGAEENTSSATPPRQDAQIDLAHQGVANAHTSAAVQDTAYTRRKLMARAIAFR